MAAMGPTSGILNCTSFSISIETYKKMHKGLNISNTLFFMPLTGRKFMVTFSNNHTVKEVFLAFLEKYDPELYEEFNAPEKYGTHYVLNLKGEHPICPNQRVEYRFDPRVKSFFLDKPVNTILPKNHVFSAAFYNLSDYDYCNS